MTVESRLRQVEKKLALGANERRAYSHAQLLQRALNLLNDRDEFEEVGPPEQVLRPDQKSHVQLVGEALARHRAQAAAAEPEQCPSGPESPCVS